MIALVTSFDESFPRFAVSLDRGYLTLKEKIREKFDGADMEWHGTFFFADGEGFDISECPLYS